MALYSWFSRHENKQYSKLSTVKLAHQAQLTRHTLINEKSSNISSKLGNTYKASELNVFQSVKILQSK